MEGGIKGRIQESRVQDRRDAEQERFCIGGIQERWDAEQVGCRNGVLFEWRDLGDLVLKFNLSNFFSLRQKGHAGVECVPDLTWYPHAVVECVPDLTWYLHAGVECVPDLTW